MGQGFVPVVDVGPALADNAVGRVDVAAAIDEACRTSGFFVITGHGIDPELLREINELTVAFFTGDEAVKSGCVADERDPTIRGLYRRPSYVAASSAIEAPPDLCELFTMNRLGEPGVAEDANLGDAYAVWSAPNRWPATPGFRSGWVRYYAAMEYLGNELMSLFATALGLDRDYFATSVDQHITNLCANWYPPVAVAPLPGQSRKGSHSDWGTFTILYHDGAPGLQVLDTAGSWRDVPIVEGGFVVNVGDMMAVWTNDRWVSTVHRVLVPPEPFRSMARVSLPYFHTPNWDAEISCLPTCTDDAHPPLHAAVTSGRYLQGKIELVYS